MKIQKGGLKLKHPDKKGFKPLYDMLNDPSCRLELLTASGKKGFMITLNIDADKTEYLSLVGSKFTKEVTSFILKFVVIHPQDEELDEPFKGISKRSETQNSFFEEAKLQQNVWIKSVAGVRPAICPSVVNFSLFNNSSSQNLIDFLNKKFGLLNLELKSLFEYLNEEVKIYRLYGIGVIVMQNVDDSNTFDYFISAQQNPMLIQNAYANLIAQTVRLFVDVGVMHFDLHSHNSLIYTTDEVNTKCLLIDFGRASDILSDSNDDFLLTDEKQRLKNIKEQEFEQMFKIYDPNDKVKYIMDVMNVLTTLDHKVTQKKYIMKTKSAYQMDWYEKVKSDRDIAINAFDILLRDTSSKGEGLLPTTIEKFKREGSFVNFTDEIEKFIVSFPPTLSNDSRETWVHIPAYIAPTAIAPTAIAPRCNEWNCTISGGRNYNLKKSIKCKYKKTKKYKYKKTRKYKKTT